jgi:hypothetical protein
MRLGGLALGDVGDDAQIAADLALAVAYHRDGDVGREGAAVTAAQGDLAGLQVAAAGFVGEGGKAVGLVGEGPAGDVFGGVEDQRGLVADEITGLVPEQALGGRVQDADDAGGVGVDDGVFGAVEDGPLQGGGLAQQDFGLGVLVHLGFEEAVGFAEGLHVLSEGFVGIGRGRGSFRAPGSGWRRPGSAARKARRRPAHPQPDRQTGARLRPGLA